jgi:hypothetical protein
MKRIFPIAFLVFLAVSVPLMGETQDLSWVQVTKKAPWQPRDSCGEMVHNGRLWLIGGWFQSFEDPPRDVWSSADGMDWTLATKSAPFKHSDLSTTLTFKDRLWIMGGWHGGRLKHASASNEVWSSADGVDWKQETKAAGWSPRLGAAGVVFRGKLWLLGGVQKYYFGDDSDLRSDVWSSEDGVTWKEATAKAAWSPRAYHCAVGLGNKMYVFGGGNYLPNYAALNDVWSSPDGVTWTRETDKAPWPPRIWFSAAVYRNRMWVLGGWSKNPSKNWNDVWHSTDGKNWTALKTKTVWPVRHEHSTYVFQDKLWVAGGMTPPLNNDVWSLYIPKDWHP